MNMMIRIKLTDEKIAQQLRMKYKTHGEFYKSEGIEAAKNYHYHPEDNEFLNCDGWKRFLKDYPHMKEKIEKMGWENIEVYPSERIFLLLLITSQYLFQKLGMQAKLDIPTNETEESLLQIKEALKCAEKYNYCFWGEGYSFGATRNTPLSILRQIEEEKYYFIIKDDNGNKIVLNRKMVKIFGKYLYFFNLPQNQELPPLPILKWTGKELVALHVENIPQCLLEKGILKIEHQEKEVK